MNAGIPDLFIFYKEWKEHEHRIYDDNDELSIIDQ